jgi:hypothetical protein
MHAARLRRRSASWYLKENVGRGMVNVGRIFQLGPQENDQSRSKTHETDPVPFTDRPARIGSDN